MAEEKSSKSRKSIYILILIVLIGILAFSVFSIGRVLYGYMQGRSTYSRIAEEAGAKKGKDSVEIDFRKLRKKYPDVKAWLYSRGTVINYPVAQGGQDSEWYLHHTLDGRWNGAGTLFIDERNEKPFAEFLTVIYGHHMRDGSMFGSLVKYRDRKYYEKHRVIRLYTPKRSYNVIVIGACTIPGNSERYRFGFSDDEEKQEYLDWISTNTETDCRDSATVKDRLVMLSTCTYEFDDARFVLFGKLEKAE